MVGLLPGVHLLWKLFFGFHAEIKSSHLLVDSNEVVTRHCWALTFDHVSGCKTKAKVSFLFLALATSATKGQNTVPFTLILRAASKKESRTPFSY